MLAGGVVVTALAGIAGGGLELWWFGAGEAAAARRVDTHIHRRFDGMVRAVSDVSSRIAGDPRAASALGQGLDGARDLFEVVLGVRRTSAAASDIAVTVYDSAALARAWAGAPSDIPHERITGAATLFITPSPLGLRLVHVQPVMLGSDRRGSVATEHVLSRAQVATTIGPAEYRLPTPLAPASLRIEGAGDRSRPGTVVLRAPSGAPLADAWVDPAALRTARTDWRRRVFASMLGLLGLTTLLLIGPLLDARMTADQPTVVRTTTGALGLTVIGGLLLWSGMAAAAGRRPAIPATLLVLGAAAAAVAALLAAPVARLRLAWRRRRRGGAATALAGQVLAGMMVAALILLFVRLLEGVTNQVSVDLHHFSIYPLRSSRLMLLAGIVAMHLAILWGATLLLVAGSARWRLPQAIEMRLLTLAAWIAPSLIVAGVAAAREWPVPASGVVQSALACGGVALVGPRLATWYRHATVAARIIALFCAFLVPTLLLHSTLDFFAERATRNLIVTEYAVQAQNYVQTLRDRLDEAQNQVNRLEELADLVTTYRPTGPDRTSDAAFLVWKQTVLARERLTSNVELFAQDGELVSRFALNVPEYTAATNQMASGCTWVEWGEVSPFGAEERRMLHAEKGVCATDEQGGTTQLGTVILHVVFDFETLPFITSQNPYFEVFRSAELQHQEDTPGSNVEVAIYGWGLQPLYTSGRSAWPITDPLFERLYRSREPFWADASTGGVRHRVYFSNDRERIFAIGYPALSWFDHFVQLAELTTFAGAMFVLALLGTAAFTRLARERPRVGRALLREIRASFYRKLFLAFVLAAIIPVLTLALFIRAYFENLLYADIEAEAARTAAVAQRVIEEGDATLRRSAEALGTPSDEFMVWIEQVIDQDVNIFDGARLVATSERDLFASGVLPTRTPDDVYRAIVLQRLPSFVRQDVLGGFTYVLAAAPVRAAGEEALLTVPLALRQREIGREIDELDRGVHLAALFFVLLGAGIGLSMAERIADPVRRLTRATGRIAQGDFDARIAVRSADELRRLADAFNSMAAELKAQRGQLERTHRLEAWAEMARQVAHEIKNPLTPIQLSAEHLQRVHADQGKPMGQVLESCVTSILGQVRLLRRIASEFSSFASSPTARPARVDLPELVAEVVDPYRTGLEGRIQIDNQIARELPPVHVDRTLIARALANIVENALHAMPGPGALTLVSSVDASHVVVTMTDTGVGMDEEALGRVFEPYFSTKTTGTGLGLPIARRNVELSGGSIDVRSARGVGTAVTLRLPRHRD